MFPTLLIATSKQYRKYIYSLDDNKNRFYNIVILNHIYNKPFPFLNKNHGLFSRAA